MNLFDMVGLTQPAAKTALGSQKSNGRVDDNGFADVVLAEEQAGQDLASAGSELGAGAESTPQPDVAPKIAYGVDKLLSVGVDGTGVVQKTEVVADAKKALTSVTDPLVAGNAGKVAVARDAGGAGADAKSINIAAKPVQAVRGPAATANFETIPSPTGKSDADNKVSVTKTVPGQPTLDAASPASVRANNNGAVLAASATADPGLDPTFTVRPALSMVGSERADVPKAGGHGSSSASEALSLVRPAGPLSADQSKSTAGTSVVNSLSASTQPAAATSTDPLPTPAPDIMLKSAAAIPVARVAADPAIQKAIQQKDAKGDLRASVASVLVDGPELPKVMLPVTSLDGTTAQLPPSHANVNGGHGSLQASFSASMTSDQAAILSGQTTQQPTTVTGSGPGNAPTTTERMVLQQVASTIPPGTAPGRIEFMLDPPELGRIEIAIEVADQSLRATLSAERQVTADLIRRHMDLLNEQFREAGFSDVDLSFAEQHRQGDQSAADASSMNSGPLEAEKPVRDVRPLVAQTISTNRMDVRL